MRTHVELTGKILEGCVDPQVMEIALRHHEKLDGSGYPPGPGSSGADRKPADRSYRRYPQRSDRYPQLQGSLFL